MIYWLCGLGQVLYKVQEIHKRWIRHMEPIKRIWKVFSDGNWILQNFKNREMNNLKSLLPKRSVKSQHEYWRWPNTRRMSKGKIQEAHACNESTLSPKGFGSPQKCGKEGQNSQDLALWSRELNSYKPIRTSVLNRSLWPSPSSKTQTSPAAWTSTKSAKAKI